MMRNPICLICLVLLGVVSVSAHAAEAEAGRAAACEVLANASRHRCLERQLALSENALTAAAAAVRKMMAQWEPGPHRRAARANFEKSARAFERYRRAECEYFASLRYGVADRDEIAIARLECALRLNAERTRIFTDLARTVVM